MSEILIFINIYIIDVSKIVTAVNITLVTWIVSDQPKC